MTCNIYLTLVILYFAKGIRRYIAPKVQTEIVKSEDRQDHDQQNETKEKHRPHNTTLKNSSWSNTNPENTCTW